MRFGIFINKQEYLRISGFGQVQTQCSVCLALKMDLIGWSTNGLHDAALRPGHKIKGIFTLLNTKLVIIFKAVNDCIE
jgi:hypothetical protein